MQTKLRDTESRPSSKPVVPLDLREFYHIALRFEEMLDAATIVNPASDEYTIVLKWEGKSITYPIPRKDFDNDLIGNSIMQAESMIITAMREVLSGEHL